MNMPVMVQFGSTVTLYFTLYLGTSYSQSVYMISPQVITVLCACYNTAELWEKAVLFVFRFTSALTEFTWSSSRCKSCSHLERLEAC